MTFSAKNIKMYTYNNVQVAGSHLVFHEPTQKWQRIEDLSEATPIKNYKHDTVVCLRTSNNLIYPLNAYPPTKFADYDETSSPIINTIIQDSIIAHLNNSPPPTKLHDKDATPFHHWAFHPQTMIDGKPIKDYRIGDKLPSSNAVVTGTVRTKPHNVHYYNRTLVTGNSIVKDERTQLYTRVQDIPTSHQITSSPAPHVIYCNLTTTSGKIVIDGTEYTDFEQCSDEPLNDAIDTFVTNHKNQPSLPSPAPITPHQ